MGRWGVSVERVLAVFTKGFTGVAGCLHCFPSANLTPTSAIRRTQASLVHSRCCRCAIERCNEVGWNFCRSFHMYDHGHPLPQVQSVSYTLNTMYIRVIPRPDTIQTLREENSDIERNMGNLGSSLLLPHWCTIANPFEFSSSLLARGICNLLTSAVHRSWATL